MGYKDKDKQSLYQLIWMRERRQKWIDENGPCKKCGSKKKLGVVNTVYEKGRQYKRSCWSWSDENRAEHLKNCIVLCHAHALEFHAEEMKKRLLGKPGYNSKLTKEMVWSIRGRLLGKESVRAIAEAHGVHHSIISHIKNGYAWTSLKASSRKVWGIRACLEAPGKRKRPDRSQQPSQKYKHLFRDGKL